MAKKTERQHINDIKKKMEALGTLREEFAPIIERTAQLYVLREGVREQFKNTGEIAVISHTNQGGKTNPAKNPHLSALMEIDDQILANERELGLTPSALKKLNEQALKIKKENPFDSLLRELAQ